MEILKKSISRHLSKNSFNTKRTFIIEKLFSLFAILIRKQHVPTPTEGGMSILEIIHLVHIAMR